MKLEEIQIKWRKKQVEVEKIQINWRKIQVEEENTGKDEGGLMYRLMQVEETTNLDG